jgi:hypothetical protein
MPHCASAVLIAFLLSASAYAETRFTMAKNEPYAEVKVGKVALATQTQNAPAIDGVLDDSCWNSARTIEDFIQFLPREGTAPSQATRVRILYDDEALYVGFDCFDNDPKSIVANTGRRDQASESDLIFFSFDSLHDHLSSFVFGVSAAGTQLDIVLSQDNSDDFSWDAVWQSKVRINETGWSGELRLPFSLFRFVEKDEMVWGLHIKREIPRLHEEIYWMPMKRGVPGLVSRAGHLYGLRGIETRRRLEFLPYTAATYHTEPGEEAETQFRMGADFKWGLSSHVTLDATVNPDFGQVEADPAELNLTAFETFFPEKRPFFIEGRDIFASNQFLNAFHSRRIGRRPQRYAIEDTDSIIDRPENTTILGAAKITGKTEGGATFGIISALTDEEFAHVVDDQNVARDRLLEPMSHYFVGNIAKESLEGRHRVRFMATSIIRNEDYSSSSFSFGNSWRSKSGFQSTGQTIVGSRVIVDHESIGGLGWNAWFDGGGRKVKFGTWTHHVDPTLELNDLGYLNRKAYRSNGVWLKLEAHEPHGYFRSMESHVEMNYDTSWDWDKLDHGIRIETDFELMNFWEFGLEIGKSNQHYDDWETWDSNGNQGPVTLRRGNHWGVLWVHSPSEQKFFGLWRLIMQQFRDGGGGFRTSGELSWRLGERLNLSLAPMWRHVTQDAQFVEEIAGDYIFAELDQRTLDLTARMNLSFSNTFTLETYLQPFMAWGDYERYRILTEEGTRNFRPSPYGDPGYDFTMESLNLNVVWRWEYRPGSTLFLVWARSHFDWIESQQLDFQPWNDLKTNIQLEPSNTFMLKISRWFG